ncbi:MAG: tyrosine-type recombinase/integrase [Alphaproteobacteria bacterium]
MEKGIVTPKTIGERHLYRRRGRYLVRLSVPPDLRRRFKGSHVERYLKTGSLRDAKRNASAAIAEIRASFDRAREGAPLRVDETRNLGEIELRRTFDGLARDFLRTHGQLPGLASAIADPATDLIDGNPLLGGASTLDYARDLIRRSGAEPTDESAMALRAMLLRAQAAAIEMIRGGLTPPPLPAAPAARGSAMAGLVEYLDQWLGALTIEAKSKAMRRANIMSFASKFRSADDVRRKGVQEWVNALVQEGKAPATVRRFLSDLRGYWRYLASLEIVSSDARPFDQLTIPGKARKGSGDSRKPFDPKDVVRLLAAADVGGDTRLVDLIRLGMWTGARIEELCALRTGHVASDHFTVVDAKTQAGSRVVPIHSRLRSTMRRLVKGSKDGYVLTGLEATKYGDRSGAIGKRFGRLKTAQGYGAEHVFHSIRKTVATLLENARVLENVAADILGHEKPRITYGLYSGGASLKVKLAAIEKLVYPKL